MTFDEANESVKAFEEDPELEDWMPTSRVYAIIEGLRKEYVPTVEMTPRAYNFLKEERNKFVKSGNDNFLSNNGLGNWCFNDEHRIDIESGEAYIDKFTAEHNHFKGLTRTEVIQAWLRPETIKVVDK